MAHERAQVSLGRLLAEARRARSLSLRELGARLTAGGRRPRGVSPQFLNDIEHDRRRPSSRLLAELGALLGLSPDRLEAAAGRGAPAVVDYLRERPEAAEPVGRLFRRARESGWTGEDWARLLETAGAASPAGSGRGGAKGDREGRR